MRDPKSSESAYLFPGTQGFSFSGVADGDYDVTAESSYPNGDLMISPPVRIKVRGADIGGIELITKPLGTISGRLVLEESNAVECKGKKRAVVLKLSFQRGTMRARQPRIGHNFFGHWVDHRIQMRKATFP